MRVPPPGGTTSETSELRQRQTGRRTDGRTADQRALRGGGRWVLLSPPTTAWTRAPCRLRRSLCGGCSGISRRTWGGGNGSKAPTISPLWRKSERRSSKVLVKTEPSSGPFPTAGNLPGISKKLLNPETYRAPIGNVPMRKLQSTAAGIPTVSQDTMVKSQEDARRRSAFSMNMT